MFWLNLTFTCFFVFMHVQPFLVLNHVIIWKYFQHVKVTFSKYMICNSYIKKTAVRLPWCLHFVSQKKSPNSSHCHEYTFLLAWGGMKGVSSFEGWGTAAANVTSGVLQQLCIFLLSTPSFQCILTVQSSLMLCHPTGMLLKFCVISVFSLPSV